LEVEHLQLEMDHAGVQKKINAEVVAFIMSQIPAKYELVMSAFRVKLAEGRTLDPVYLEYWGATFNGVEQPNEPDGNAAVYANGGKKSNTKKENRKKFKGNCNY